MQPAGGFDAGLGFRCGRFDAGRARALLQMHFVATVDATEHTLVRACAPENDWVHDHHGSNNGDVSELVSGSSNVSWEPTSGHGSRRAAVRSSQPGAAGESVLLRATPEVRTIAQLFGHIADAYCGMCAAADGSMPPQEGLEKSATTKAALVKALADGVSYCQSVMERMTDQKGSESVPFYFGPTPRLSIL